MKTEHLSGLIAAPFTPMHADGSINLSLIPEYYQFLKANGVKGAFICGSTGEGVSLTFRERETIAEAWAEASTGDNDFKVMTLIGGTCLADCVELAKHAQRIGLYGVSLTAPYYFKPATVEALASICISVAEAAPDISFYYYHIPALTGVNFPMYDLLLALDGRIKNFVGIKYTYEDFMDFLSCISYKEGKYDMLWGRDENMLPALAVGVQASVGSTFNYAAPLYYQLIDAFNNGNLLQAQQLQQKSIDMIRLLGKYGGIATGKSYMKLVGLDCGEFRLPVKNMNDEDFELFTKEASSIGFDTFKSFLPKPDHG